MTYQIMFYGGLAAALLTLIITVYVYVKMNIRRVISDLTGIKWKRPFEKKSSSQAKEEEKRTTNEIRLKKQDLEGDEITELMEEEVAATALLDESDVEETTLLSSDVELEDETTLLGECMDETTLLTEEPAFYFRKEIDVVVTHSTTKL
jgi:hypothetical protein